MYLIILTFSREISQLVSIYICNRPTWMNAIGKLEKSPKLGRWLFIWFIWMKCRIQRLLNKGLQHTLMQEAFFLFSKLVCIEKVDQCELCAWLLLFHSQLKKTVLYRYLTLLHYLFNGCCCLNLNCQISYPNITMPRPTKHVCTHIYTHPRTYSPAWL